MSTMDRIEVLDRERRRMLIVVLAAFNLWQIPGLFTETFESALPRTFIIIVALIGSFAFMYSMWRMVRLKKAISNDVEAQKALADERVRNLWLKASQKGWAALLIWLAGFRVAGAFTDIPLELVMQIGIIIGVSIPLIWFLYLDRE